MDNQKHHNFNDDLLPEIDDIFKPEFKRDTRGRYFMQLPGYGKWMVSVEPGSKIISQGSENEEGGPATDPGSLKTGSLHANTVITIGNNIYLDGGSGCIHVGDYLKRIKPSISLCGGGLVGYVASSVVFGFFLEDYKYNDSITLGKGDVIIGDISSDSYLLWDDSTGILSVSGDIVIAGDIESANYVADTSGYKLTYVTGAAEFQQGLIGGWEISSSVLKKEYTIAGSEKTKLEFSPGNPGHMQAAYSATGSFSLPGDVYMIQMTQGSTGDLGGTPIPRIDIYNDGVKRLMLNSDGLYFFDADGTTVNNKIELTQATFKDVVIETGAIAASSEPSIQGWSHDIAFSVTDLNTVAWSSGTITLTNGDSFSINAGNTGNMGTSTYIYLSKDTSETVLQTTTTAATAIGGGKILIAFAKNSTNEALFQVFGGIGGIKMNGAALENLTVDTAQVAALAIEEAKLGNLSVSSGKIIADAVTASKINVVGLNGTTGRIVVADSTDANTVTSGINSYAATLITAGKIVISGGTTLSDWRSGSDTTKIDGGNIYTNTITATQIATNTITANEIASNAVDTNELNANAVTSVKINAGAVTATKINVTNLAAVSVDAGNIRVGGNGNTYGSISVKDSSGTEVALLNNNAIIVRQNKAFAAESSSGGTYTQFYTSGLNGIIEITQNAAGSFGIKDDNSSDYFMKWTNYDISVWKTMLPMVGTIDLGSSTYKWDDVFCNAMKGLYGEIYFDQAGRIQFTNHCDPSGTGTYNLGGASRYWADVSYKTLTDRGCLGWFDDGVELQDGTIVSDIEAIKAIKKHPTKLTVYGKPMMDYKTLPKVSYKPAADHDGTIFKRDKNDNPYIMEGKKKITVQDGAEMTSIFSIMLGAIKELSAEIDKLKSNN